MRNHRLLGWVIATIFLVLIIYLIQPQQIAVSVYKISLVTLGGVLGYWLDRSLFPYARPDTYLACSRDSRYCTYGSSPDTADFPVADKYYLVFAASMLRRSIIVFGCMIAISMGA